MQFNPEASPFNSALKIAKKNRKQAQYLLFVVWWATGDRTPVSRPAWLMETGCSRPTRIVIREWIEYCSSDAALIVLLAQQGERPFAVLVSPGSYHAFERKSVQHRGAEHECWKNKADSLNGGCEMTASVAWRSIDKSQTSLCLFVAVSIYPKLLACCNSIHQV